MITQGQIRIVGTEVTFEEEETINKNNKMYQIKNQSKRAWSMGAKIEINPEPSLDDTYEIDYANGYITFDKVKDRGELIISGEYFPSTIIGKVLSYNLEKNREFMDFQAVDGLIEESYPTALGISGEIETLEIYDTYFLDVFEDKTKVLLDIQVGNKIESYFVYLENVNVGHNAGELVKKNIKFRKA